MKRQIVIPVIAVAVLVLGGAGGYFGGALLVPPAKDGKDAKKGEAAVVAGPVVPPDPNLFYDLPAMLVTLNDPDEPGHVLQLTVSVECPSAGDIDKLQAYLPRVLDVFQTDVRELTLAQLRGTANLEALRRMLKKDIDKQIAPGKIKRVLFRGITIE